MKTRTVVVLCPFAPIVFVAAWPMMMGVNAAEEVPTQEVPTQEVRQAQATQANQGQANQGQEEAGVQEGDYVLSTAEQEQISMRLKNGRKTYQVQLDGRFNGQSVPIIREWVLRGGNNWERRWVVHQHLIKMTQDEEESQAKQVAAEQVAAELDADVAGVLGMKVDAEVRVTKAGEVRMEGVIEPLREWSARLKKVNESVRRLWYGRWEQYKRLSELEQQAKRLSGLCIERQLRNRGTAKLMLEVKLWDQAVLEVTKEETVLMLQGSRLEQWITKLSDAKLMELLTKLAGQPTESKLTELVEYLVQDIVLGGAVLKVTKHGWSKWEAKLEQHGMSKWEAKLEQHKGMLKLVLNELAKPEKPGHAGKVAQLVDMLVGLTRTALEPRNSTNTVAKASRAPTDPLQQDGEQTAAADCSGRRVGSKSNHKTVVLLTATSLTIAFLAVSAFYLWRRQQRTTSSKKGL